MGHKKLVITDPRKYYPVFLQTISNSRLSDGSQDEPRVFEMSAPRAAKKLQDFVVSAKPSGLIDNYAEQYAELLLSKNAHLYQANYDVQVASVAKLLDEHYAGKQPWEKGSWVYYPWLDQLVHVLSQSDFEALRTIRNRDLITSPEQTKLFNFEVACFGMSVGSANAQALAITGISRRIKLVDGAVISGSNLNRILTGVPSVGQNKAHIIGRQIYEMNPYAQVAYFDKVTVDNIEAILDEPWPVRAVIDEIDDIEMKIKIRLAARARRIPVLMASELGDTVVLDVERFDLEPQRPLFHGTIPGIETVTSETLVNQREWMKYAMRILDPKNMSVKLQKSLMKIGTTIVTHPQLGGTVMITGGILAFAVKNIALKSGLNSGRYVISLEKEMLSDYKTRKYKRLQKRQMKIVKTALNSM